MSDPTPFMQRAIEAAAAARGRTSPNPWVGAVVVRDGAVISVGATARYGGAHAEAAALANVDARGATLFTTLEPCMPFEGKRTPPCVEAIIESGVSRVVVAIEDPHAPVGGQGVAYLRSRGLRVEVGDGAQAVTSLLRPYLKFRATGRPYVIAKFAASLDGKVGAPGAGIRWLSGPVALERAHQDRSWVDCIAVGSGTVLADDPALTARPGGVLGTHQPIRLVLDARGRVPADAKVLGPGAILATARPSSAFRTAVTATGATVLELEAGSDGVNLDQLMRTLGQRAIVSMIVEGGPTVLAAFFESGHVDEVHAYLAPVLLGAEGIELFPSGSSIDPTALRDVVIEPLHPDVLIRGYTGDWEPT